MNEYLYDSLCTVKRHKTTLGEFNRPVTTQEVVSQYRCLLSKMSALVVEDSPQGTEYRRFKLFTFPDADIQIGDLVIVNGLTCVAEIPFLYRDHMEVEIRYQKEV